MALEPLNAPKNLIKPSSSELLTFALKFFIALVLGLTVALVGRAFSGYGNLSFTFMTVVVILLFMSVAKKWGALFTLFFAGFCLLAGLLLQMYALVAPGS